MTPDEYEAEFVQKAKEQLAEITRTRSQPCLSYLQAKSDQAEPVKVPQYERD